MYKKKQIIDCLNGEVGWRQNSNPDFDSLVPSLLVSRSGRYFNDEHPLINYEHIDQAFKNYQSYIYPEYQTDVDYLKGNKVDFNGTIFELLIETVQNVEPGSDNSIWIAVDPLSQKLESLVQSSIDDVISNIFIHKKIMGITKSIFEDVQIFDGPGNIRDRITKLGRFVGIAIRTLDQKYLSIILKNIGLQLTDPNPLFKLFLFHTSSEDPIKTFSFDYTDNNRFQWFTAEDTELKEFSLLTDSGGYWMIGYYEDDLVGQAIRKDYDFGSSPTCGTCNRNGHYYKQWSRFAEYIPFTVSANDIVGITPSGPDGAKLFDLDAVSRNHSYENFGLNIDLSVQCDVSDLICKQSELFADAIRKEVAFKILQEFAYNTRNNVISKEVQDKALYELNGKENPTGFMKRYKKTMEAVDFDLSDMNSACLPCNESRGLSSSKV